MPTSARCRVRIWQLTPDYISSDSMGVTTVTQYTHKLGTDALFVLPSVSASSTPSSADWTLWGAISSGSRCLHICEINEQFIVTYNPEYHGLFRDVNGAAQAPTGTGYYKMMVWK